MFLMMAPDDRELMGHRYSKGAVVVHAVVCHTYPNLFIQCMSICAYCSSHVPTSSAH